MRNIIDAFDFVCVLGKGKKVYDCICRARLNCRLYQVVRMLQADVESAGAKFSQPGNCNIAGTSAFAVSLVPSSLHH